MIRVERLMVLLGSARELAPLNSQAPAAVTDGCIVRTGEGAARACRGGTCDENYIAKALGGNKADFRFFDAIWPRIGAEFPVCADCEAGCGQGFSSKATEYQTDELKK